MQGQCLILIEEFIEKFRNTLEELCLSIFHICNDNFNHYFDGNRLSDLCNKLIQLKKFSFLFKMKLIEKANENFILKLAKSFSTPFWLCGPLGSVQVAVDYHSKWNLIQLFSFPYFFSQVALTHTIDLMHLKFNFSQENIPTNNLSIQLQPLWFNMRRIMLCFDDKQDIPLKFLHALQCSFNYYCQKQLIFNVEKTLVLGYERGILPKNIENHIQFVQFTKLFLSISNNNNINFDIQSK